MIITEVNRNSDFRASVRCAQLKFARRWKAIFFTDCRANGWIAEGEGGTEEITVYFSDHHFGFGQLRCELFADYEDANYRRGFKRICEPIKLNIEVVYGPGSKADAEAVEVMLPIYKGDKGDPLTWADLTPEQIAELQRPATDAVAKIEAAQAEIDKAEEARVQAEEARATAETARARTETQRVEAEKLRQTREQERVTAEKGRQKAETERGEQEQLRVSTENDRRTAEQQRGKNEQARVQAEQARVSAETKRQDDFNAAQAQRSTDYTAAETHRDSLAATKLSDLQQTFNNAEQQRAEEFAGYADAIDAKLDKSVWNAGFTLVGYRTEDNGTLTAVNGWSSSELIPINPNCNIELAAYVGSAHRAAHYYDGALNHIGAGCAGAIANPSTCSFTITPADIPEGAAFIRFNSLTHSAAHYRYIQNLESAQGAVADAIAKGKLGLFIDLWNAACGTYGKYDPTNAPDAEHPFYLNTLWLTYKEAVDVMNAGPLQVPYPQGFQPTGLRTNLLSLNIVNVGCANDRQPDISQLFRGCTTIEVIRIGVDSTNYPLAASSIYLFATACIKLRKILGIINIAYLRNKKYSSNRDAFTNCPLLEEVRLKNLCIDYDFKDCPLLSLASFQYMVTNAANTDKITLTLHPNVYAKLTGDTTNEAAAALSADELAQWQAVLTDAAAKNISFACV